MKRSSSFRFALALIMLLALTPSSATAATCVLGVDTIASGNTNQYDPEFSGGAVVWTAKNVLMGTDSDIMMRFLSNTTAFSASGTDALEQRFPDVSRGRAVWEETDGGSKSVRMYDPVTEGVTTVASDVSAGPEVHPRVDGIVVVWENVTSNSLRCSVLGVSSNIAVPGASDVDYYDVDNGRIVWVTSLAEEQIRMWRPGIAGATSELVYTVPSSRDVMSLQVHGDRAVMTTRTNADGMLDAQSIDLRTKAVSYISYSTVGNDNGNPTVFHKNKAWENRAGDTDLWYQASGFDAQAASSVAADESDPSMFGRKVAFEINVGAADDNIQIVSGPVESHRTAGNSRYATAVEASKQYFSAAKTAVLCSGTNYPDALCATPLARLLQGPLLLTDPSSLNALTRDELTRLGVTTVYIVGGTAAVSDPVYDQLIGLGFDVERISGANRYATAAAVGARVYELAPPGIDPVAFYVRGDNFPDALAAGPVAAGAHAPILLVQTNALPAETYAFIHTYYPEEGYVVGSESAISHDVEIDIFVAQHASSSLDRLAGPSRYDTGVAVIERGLQRGWIDLDTLGVAVGTNYPDALGGGAAMGYYGSPLLLTPSTSVPSGVTAFLTRRAYEIGRVDVFGGTGVVSDSVKTQISNRVR